MSASTRHARPSLWDIAVAVTFASAGIAKLVPARSEETLFKSWGWTRRDMQTIGTAELLGAALLTTRATKKAGAALLSATSVCILTTELRHKNDALVTPRAGLLAAALSGFFGR